MLIIRNKVVIISSFPKRKIIIKVIVLVKNKETFVIFKNEFFMK